jgi:hypothetical protein
MRFGIAPDILDNTYKRRMRFWKCVIILSVTYLMTTDGTNFDAGVGFDILGRRFHLCASAWHYSAPYVAQLWGSLCSGIVRNC